MGNPLADKGISDREYGAVIGTMLGEGYKDNGVAGYAGIGDAINNRYNSDKAYGRPTEDSLAGVAYASRPNGKGREFDTWNPQVAPNAFATAIKAQKAALDPAYAATLDKGFQQELEKAAQAAHGVFGSGELAGITKGATFYNNPGATSTAMNGTMNSLRPTGNVRIGSHVFGGPDFDPSMKFDLPSALDASLNSYRKTFDTPGERAAMTRAPGYFGSSFGEGTDWGPPVWDGTSTNANTLAAPSGAVSFPTIAQDQNNPAGMFHYPGWAPSNWEGLRASTNIEDIRDPNYDGGDQVIAQVVDQYKHQLRDEDYKSPNAASPVDVSQIGGALPGIDAMLSGQNVVGPYDFGPQIKDVPIKDNFTGATRMVSPAYAPRDLRSDYWGSLPAADKPFSTDEAAQGYQTGGGFGMDPGYSGWAPSQWQGLRTSTNVEDRSNGVFGPPVSDNGFDPGEFANWRTPVTMDAYAENMQPSAAGVPSMYGAIPGMGQQIAGQNVVGPYDFSFNANYNPQSTAEAPGSIPAGNYGWEGDQFSGLDQPVASQPSISPYGFSSMQPSAALTGVQNSLASQYANTPPAFAPSLSLDASPAAASFNQPTPPHTPTPTGALAASVDTNSRHIGDVYAGMRYTGLGLENAPGALDNWSPSAPTAPTITQPSFASTWDVPKAPTADPYGMPQAKSLPDGPWNQPATEEQLAAAPSVAPSFSVPLPEDVPAPSFANAPTVSPAVTAVTPKAVSKPVVAAPAPPKAIRSIAPVQTLDAPQTASTASSAPSAMPDFGSAFNSLWNSPNIAQSRQAFGNATGMNQSTLNALTNAYDNGGMLTGVAYSALQDAFNSPTNAWTSLAPSPVTSAPMPDVNAPQTFGGWGQQNGITGNWNTDTSSAASNARIDNAKSLVDPLTGQDLRDLNAGSFGGWGGFSGFGGFGGGGWGDTNPGLR